jgi:hypothetical protein
VHPHLVCSQLLNRFSPAGIPTENKAPCAMTGEPDVSRHPRPLRRIVMQCGIPVLYCLTAWSHERGRFLPTALMRPSLWHPCRDFAIVLAPLPLSWELQPGRTSCSAQGWYGSENAEAAEVTVHAVS